MKPERTPQTALIEQLHRLHDLCKSYDNGMCVAMDIAVALRTLLHDSPNGRSLLVLTQCGLRDKVKFLDTTAQRGTISFFAVGDNVSNKNIQVATHIYCGLLCKRSTIPIMVASDTHSPLLVNPPYIQITNKGASVKIDFSPQRTGWTPTYSRY